MATDDRNKRTAGYKRVNALFERLRTKDISPLDDGDDPLAEADEPRCSLVVLLRELAVPDEADLRRAVEQAFGLVPPASDYGAEEFVVQAGPLGTIRVDGWTFDTEVGEDPYFDDSHEAASHIPELRLRAAVRDHAAWLRVDLSDSPGDASETERVTRVAKLLAVLAPEVATALFRPATGQVGLFTPEVVEKLAAGQVNDAFKPADKPVPIAGVQEDDPRMAEAEAEANRRFGEFLTAFASREPGETFAVKVPFEDEHGVEFMWVSVTAVDDSHIDGRLDNEPAFVQSVRHGQAVRVLRGTLNDWLYTQGGELRGGFTLKLLGDQLKPTDHHTEDAA